ncbi:hypothetical protein Hdeb2414_s0345g00873051 [Helianthus debilis subsp. tardiflorus]
MCLAHEGRLVLSLFFYKTLSLLLTISFPLSLQPTSTTTIISSRRYEKKTKRVKHTTTDMRLNLR